MSKDANSILDELRQELGEGKVDFIESTKQTTVYIDSKVLAKAMKLLKKEFGFLADLTAAEYDEHIETIYHLMSLEDCSELRVKVKLSKDDLKVISLVPFWNAANVQEREAFDMFGIEFLGHPNLKSILLPEDANTFPLRKDFNLCSFGREG